MLITFIFNQQILFYKDEKVSDSNVIQIISFYNNKMGNYCCANQDASRKSQFVRNKQHIKDQCTISISLVNTDQTSTPDLSISSRGSKSPRTLQAKSKIGKGGQGQIFEVQVIEQSDSSETIKSSFAMKKITKKGKSSSQKRSLQVEKKIMHQIDSPFISKMIYSYEDQEYYYYMMELAEGGDLFSFMDYSCGKGQEFHKMGEDAIRFVAAGVILGLQELHLRNFLYRDLKSQNILISSDGYPVLSDFGLAEYHDPTKKQNPRGTVLYLSPQVALQQGYDRGLDLWALGVLLHLLTFDSFPFHTREILSSSYYSVAKSKQGKHKLAQLRIGFQLKDLINKLLKAKKEDRLGYKSIEQLKQHKFFKSLNWQKYRNKQLDSPLQKIVRKYDICKEPLHRHGKNGKRKQSYIWLNTAQSSVDDPISPQLRKAFDSFENGFPYKMQHNEH